MPYYYEIWLGARPPWLRQGLGAAPVLVAPGWVTGSAGVVQGIQNSAVVSPNLHCAVLICVLVLLTLSSPLCCSVGQVCVKEKVRGTE